MGDLTKGLLALLTQLLPGFITAWVVFGLTSYPKPAQFERIIQALIYGVIIGALVAVERWLLLGAGRYIQFGVWEPNSDLVASVVSAVCLGLSLAHYSESDKFYSFARRLRLTRRTAYPSEWYGAFNARPARYVVLHLEGGRRINGYPTEWPSDPATGHFRLTDAEWANDDGTVPLDGNDSTLVQAKQVQLVEFLKTIEERTDGTKATQSAPA